MLRRLLAIAICLAPVSAMAMEFNAQFGFGQRWLSDFWEPLDEQPVLGVQGNFGEPEWPVNLAFSASGSFDFDTIFDPVAAVDTDVVAFVVEGSAGVVWLPLKKSTVRPYLGAGVNIIWGGLVYDYGSSDLDDFDTSVGFYANTGVYFKLGDMFSVGLDGRIVRGTDIDLFGRSGNADYEQLGVMFGFSWGEK